MYPSAPQTPLEAHPLPYPKGLFAPPSLVGTSQHYHPLGPGEKLFYSPLLRPRPPASESFLNGDLTAPNN